IVGGRVASAVAVFIMLAAGLPAVTGGPSSAGAVTATSDVAARAGLAPGPDILWESDADQNADYDAIAASGATWTTIDFDWNSIQNEGPTAWHWNIATDRAVLNARAHGLKIIAVAAYSPPWARRSDCPSGELHCFPANADDYARFVAAAAARYGASSPIERLRNSVAVWSIWNEPNHQEFSQPKPDPDKYAAMIKASYPAIKAADPTATVLTGGTAPAPDAPDGTDYTPLTWLKDLYARGAGGFFDGVAHHPYMFPVNPLEAHSWNAFTQTQFLYDVMVAHGDGAKKVWGTEMGAPTGTDSQALTDAQQAQWVRDYYLGWNTTFRAFTGPMIWFQLRDSGTNVGHWWENLGLMHTNRAPKPAYGAFQEVMGAGVATTPVSLVGRTLSKPGRRVAPNPKGGFYTLDRNGTVTPYDGAPYLGSASLPSGLARGMVVTPDGLGYLVLDGYGGVHKFGTAASGVFARRSTGWFGFDIARDIALTPDGRGYTVLDGYGGLHTSGAAPRVSLGYWPGWDVARSFAYSPSGTGAYLLDAFGGVHVSGDAVARNAGYWPGWDIARDLVVSPDNRGYAVVDGFGGVHRAGSAPQPGNNRAYRGYDHAGGLAMLRGGYVVAG
ncbi:MAG: hypothetical protein ACXVJF_16680, partial [Acidimicrobiia bacterium]